MTNLNISFFKTQTREELRDKIKIIDITRYKLHFSTRSVEVVFQTLKLKNTNALILY